MQMTLARACMIAGYPQPNLIDERVLIRRECGDDIITQVPPGRPLALDIDDAAALCLYADLRNAQHSYPVKLAGLIASRIRTAMRANPRADQLVTVTLANGFSFTLPTDDLDLTSGFNTGGYVTTALLVDVRNYRERVTRSIEAFEPGTEADDEAA